MEVLGGGHFLMSEVALYSSRGRPIRHEAGLSRGRPIRFEAGLSVLRRAYQFHDGPICQEAGQSVRGPVCPEAGMFDFSVALLLRPVKLL